MCYNEKKETYFSKSSLLLESLKKLRTQFEGFHEGIKVSYESAKW